MMLPKFGISEVWASNCLIYKRKVVEIRAPGLTPFSFSFPPPVNPFASHWSRENSGPELAGASASPAPPDRYTRLCWYRQNKCAMPNQLSFVKFVVSAQSAAASKACLPQVTNRWPQSTQPAALPSPGQRSSVLIFCSSHF